MERMGSFLDCEWESICKLLSAPQPEIDSSHLLDYSPPVNQNNYTQSSGSASFGTQCLDEHMQMWNDASLSMDFIVDPQNDGSFAFMFVEDPTKETTFSDEGSANQSSPSNEITLKRKNPVYDAPMLLNDKEEMTNSLPLPKKKARISNPTNKGRKSKKLTKNDSEMTEETIGCDPSEDALSNGSEEISEAMAESDSNKSVTLTSTGKKRASRGEATDPQSLYARRRRMRINERLKILQSLVPNGTKVDISTMLEEAFHYVKFLQHQIRLLSSDELWMYAPLAYNGVDVGAYKRLSSFQ